MHRKMVSQEWPTYAAAHQKVGHRQLGDAHSVLINSPLRLPLIAWLLRFAPMTPLAIALAAILSYLLGSIPTGYLMAKAKGVDIRSVGSGNIGATNVFRALGKTAGVVTLLVDCAKGVVAVVLVPRLFALDERDLLALVCALSVILGHNYTCWLRFKGGKGIATSAGALLGLAWLAMLICLGVWLVVFGVGRYVSLASILAAVALPVAVFVTRGIGALFYLSIALAALAIWRHRSNIQRLLNGTENRFGRKPQAEADPS
jgi:glycerol-3-phosphate acyltransferase PlsY